MSSYSKATNNRRGPAEFFSGDIRLNIFGGDFDYPNFFGRFSADKNASANPVIGYG